jgi:DHA3 family macrolide efflux protein-like MFS transporter
MSYQAPPNGFRTFLVVWVTQSISVFGTALTFFATTIWLTQTLYPRPEQKPELALALSANGLAFALPAVFGAPLAGAWADRHDRKRTMMAMDFVNGGLSLLLATLLVTHTLQLWMLLVLSALYSTFGAFHSSSFDTSYAMLVPEEQLPRANGMMQTMWSLSNVLSPAAAAILISIPALARQGVVPIAALGQLADGTPLAIALDAVTFFAASATLLFLHVPSPKRTDLDADGRLNKSMWADVRQGALYIWHRRPMLWLLGSFTVVNFVSTPLGVLLPLIVKFNLAADWSARGFSFETALALIGSVLGVGGVVSGFLISTWAAMAFILDGMSPIMNAHSQAIWQTQTPRELQGRVFAVRTMIAWVTIPLSTVLAGWAGGMFNPGIVVAVLGAILALFCVAQLFNRALLRVEDKAWLDQMAARAEAETA